MSARDVVLQSHWNDAIVEAVATRVRGGSIPGLVFVQLKEHGRLLADQLSQALSGLVNSVPLVTADLPQGERQRLASLMKERPDSCPVAVCTSTWATGINIPGLRWVLWAGQGQAPIGFLQARGRGSRPAEGKTDFELIVVEDIDNPRYRNQAVQRLEHMRKAGYEVCSEQLLSQMIGQARPSRPTRRRRAALPAIIPALQSSPQGDWMPGMLTCQGGPNPALLQLQLQRHAPAQEPSHLEEIFFIVTHTRWVMVCITILVLGTLIRQLF